MTRARWTVGAAAVWLLYAAPALHMVLSALNLATFYSENLGYRYFMALRVVDGGRQDFTHPGQGPLLGLFQQAFYIVLKLVNPWPAESLLAKINLFGYATLMLNAALMAVVLFLIARDTRLSGPTKLAFFSLPLVYVYSNFHGFMLSRYPDYPPYLETSTLATTYLFMRLRPSSPPGAYVPLAVLTGLAFSLKVTHGLFPAALGFVHLMLYGTRRLRSAALFAVVALSTYALSTAVYYRFSPKRFVRFFRELHQWSATLSGDPSFLPLFLDVFASWSGHGYSVFWWFLAGMSLTVGYVLIRLILLGPVQRLRDLAMVLAILGVATISFYGVVRRGAGTSVFEFFLLLGPMVILAASRLHPLVSGRTLLSSLALLNVLCAAAWTGAHWRGVTSGWGMNPADHRVERAVKGRWNEQVYEWNRSHQMPIVVLMPSNNFVVGSVEDMMMRGLSARMWQHWYTANDNPTRLRLFPRYRFTRYEALESLPESYVFMWSEPRAGEELGRPGFPTAAEMAEHAGYLDRHGFRALLGTDRCRSWEVEAMVVHSCVIGYPKPTPAAVEGR